jgi:hypothetical protein
VVCHSESSVVYKEVRCLVKFSDIIEANVPFSLFVGLLSLRLSERYFVLFQVERALRFSEIRALMCRGRFLTWSVGGSGKEEHQAESYIDSIWPWIRLSLSGL